MAMFNEQVSFGAQKEKFHFFPLSPLMQVTSV
jgi:hypothetical protein